MEHFDLFKTFQGHHLTCEIIEKWLKNWKLQPQTVSQLVLIRGLEKFLNNQNKDNMIFDKEIINNFEFN